MAITRVTASIGTDETDLQRDAGSSYSGELTAPTTSGNYNITVSAYDNAGNISVKSRVVSVTMWHTPKTNWKKGDKFNIDDYNRIKNNLEYIRSVASFLIRQFNHEDMGDDIESYAAYWDVDVFNMWERNIELANEHILKKDFGASQRFFPNGKFISFDELNRIESAELDMKQTLEKIERGKRRMSFRLGDYKGVRV